MYGLFDPIWFALFNEKHGPNASYYLVGGSAAAGFLIGLVLVVTGIAR